MIKPMYCFKVSTGEDDEWRRSTLGPISSKLDLDIRFLFNHAAYEQDPKKLPTLPAFLTV